MSNVLKITVENPDEILNAGHSGAGAVVQVQSSSTVDGVYADVGTVAVVAGTRLYTFYDVAGGSTTWYRTRYETSAGVATSDWSEPFQVGDETAGLLCAIHDVEQELGETLTANEQENVLEKIRQVSVAIEGYTGRWFRPRPLSGTTTYRFHSRDGTNIEIPKGIRSITTLGLAIEDQPSSGGTYTTATATDYAIDPPDGERDAGWPGTRVVFRSNPTGSIVEFEDARYGVEITGAFGWASVPADIQGVAVRAVVRRHIGKGGGATVAVGPNGSQFLLPDMSGADRGVLEFYKHRVWR